MLSGGGLGILVRIELAMLHLLGPLLAVRVVLLIVIVRVVRLMIVFLLLVLG